MTPPFILIDDGDISAFACIADLEDYVESPDISCYSAFDATGRRLALTADVSSGRFVVEIKRVRVEEAPGGPRPEILQDALREYLSRHGITASEGEELSSLLERVLRIIKFLT